MEKKILTIIVICALCWGSFTTYAGDPVKKGPIAGWHYSDILKDGSSLYGGHYNSFFVGFFSNKNLMSSGLLQFNSAIMYYQNGSKEDNDNWMRLHYLNIPLSLRVKIGPVYAFAGASGAIKLGGENHTLGVKTDVKEINTWDAGVHGGIGVKWSFIEINLTPIDGNTFSISLDLNDGYKSQYLQLGLLLYIGEGK